MRRALAQHDEGDILGVAARGREAAGLHDIGQRLVGHGPVGEAPHAAAGAEGGEQAGGLERLRAVERARLLVEAADGNRVRRADGHAVRAHDAPLRERRGLPIRHDQVGGRAVVDAPAAADAACRVYRYLVMETHGTPLLGTGGYALAPSFR